MGDTLDDTAPPARETRREKPQTLDGIEATKTLKITSTTETEKSFDSSSVTTTKQHVEELTLTASGDDDANISSLLSRSRARTRGNGDDETRDVSRDHLYDDVMSGDCGGIGGGEGSVGSNSSSGQEEFLRDEDIPRRESFLLDETSPSSVGSGSGGVGGVGGGGGGGVGFSGHQLTKSLYTRTTRYPSGGGGTTRKCVLTLDGYSYVIVASTPDSLSKRDDSTGSGTSCSIGNIGGSAIGGAGTAGAFVTASERDRLRDSGEQHSKSNSPTDPSSCVVGFEGGLTPARVDASGNICEENNRNSGNVNGQIARHGSLTIVRRSNSRKSFSQIDAQQTAITSPSPTAAGSSIGSFYSSKSSPSSAPTNDNRSKELIHHTGNSPPPTTGVGTATATAEAESEAAAVVSSDSIESTEPTQGITTLAPINKSATQTIVSPFPPLLLLERSSKNNSYEMQPSSPNDKNLHFKLGSGQERLSARRSQPDSIHTVIQPDLETENLPPVDTPDALTKAAERLRLMLHRLPQGHVRSEDLQRNMNYAARVLEAIIYDNSRSPTSGKTKLGRSSSSPIETEEQQPGGDGDDSNIGTRDDVKDQRCNGNCKNLNCSQHSHESHTCNRTSDGGSGGDVVGDNPDSGDVANQDNNNSNSNCTLNNDTAMPPQEECQQEQQQQQNNESSENQTSIDSRTKGVTLPPQTHSGPTGPPIQEEDVTDRADPMQQVDSDAKTQSGESTSTSTTAATDIAAVAATTAATAAAATTEATCPTTNICSIPAAAADGASAVSGTSSTSISSNSSSSKNATVQRQKRLRTPVWASSISTNKTRLAEEDDELSEVQPDAVPPEVREWLTSTFTRQLASTRRRSEDKPKFRTVAHAIRAGIFVDRIYRRVSSTPLMQFPSEVVKALKSMDDWSFDMFALADAANGQPLKYLTYDLLNRYGIIHKFKISPSVLETFLHKVEEGYCRFRNPYHNNLHGADVTQSIHYMLCQTGLMNWLTDLEIFATLTAAVIHDYEHTGTTNNFHVMSGSETALIYNDRAVLENHHVSATFRLLKEDDSNILTNMSREEFREFRTLVIEMVLATDMSQHFHLLKNTKTLLTLNEPPLDKAKALSLVLHCCDISHPAKRWNIHHRWTMLLLEEFFRQGDLERELGLPFSPLCDRKNTLVAESQIGFIDFIVDPSMTGLSDMLEQILTPIAPMCKNVNASLDAGDVPVDAPSAATSGAGLAVASATSSAAQRSIRSTIQSDTISEDAESREGDAVSMSSSSPPTMSSIDEGSTMPRMGPSKASLKFTIRKPWAIHLAENKKIWKEQAIKDAIARQTAIAAEED